MGCSRMQSVNNPLRRRGRNLRELWRSRESSDVRAF